MRFRQPASAWRIGSTDGPERCSYVPSRMAGWAVPMSSPSKRPRSPNQPAKSIIDIATGQKSDRDPTPEEQGKGPWLRWRADGLADLPLPEEDTQLNMELTGTAAEGGPEIGGGIA
jgi:hypothetical protein